MNLVMHCSAIKCYFRRFKKGPNLIPHKRTTTWNASNHKHLARVIDGYRTRGHLVSTISPLLKTPDYISELNFSDLNHVENINYVVNHLKKSYCGDLTSDLSYLPTKAKDFMATELEKLEEPDRHAQQNVGKLLIESQALDEFLAVKFPTLKRYGLEGAEAMLAFFYQIFEMADLDEQQCVDIAMTHRGRLNLLINTLNVPPSLVFHKVRGGDELQSSLSIYTGDVLSHLWTQTKIKNVLVNLLPNPSHLEIINPVSMGYTKAGQTVNTRSLNIQIHGDAAFSGQGVNQESLMLSKVPGFNVKGTIHLIVNNELGFTTPGERGRSALYTSHLAKMIDAPVIHCNGLNPRELMRATSIAYKYNKKFQEDVFIDLHCMRVRGHNEVDDPTMTNPGMYKIIHSLHPKLTEFYMNSLNKQQLNQKEIKVSYQKYLNSELDKEITLATSPANDQWRDKLDRDKQLTVWDTGFPQDYLQKIMEWSVHTPVNFQVHPRIAEAHIKFRLKNCTGIQQDNKLKLIDWATAEALAFGSLLLQRYNVRLCGQDVGRGTFAHRHFELIDQETEEKFVPLNNIPHENAGQVEIVNSILSEEAVLAFEYGYSIRNTKTLVLWEAQFGDFFNTAQTVFDTFISSGEAKWGIPSNLVVLLPHGNEGAGPEHSSCRIERFLQLSTSKEEDADGDMVNMFIVWPSTPAQYFHILRQQMIRDVRIPLIVVTPKALLRNSEARSPILDMLEGTNYQSVLCQDVVDTSKITKIIFTNGQLVYALKNLQLDHVVICSLEMLCPFPAKEIKDCISRFPNVKEFIWCQEEARNQGPWAFVRERMLRKIGVNLKYIGRRELPTPAYGLARLHKRTNDEIFKQIAQ